MAHFAFVKRFESEDTLNLPVRKTKYSAGYDFEVAEDIVIPSYFEQYDKLKQAYGGTFFFSPLELSEVAKLTKKTQAKPTLVPTGVKCYLADNEYLELSVRSSCPLKHWLILANGVGIIDSDYVDNKDNDGEIFFQIINMSPFSIKLSKGDIIGQGIIKEYKVIEDDKSTGDRTGGFGSTSQPQRGLRAQAQIYDEYCDFGLNNQSDIEISYPNGNYSHAEGYQNQACGDYSHAEGTLTFAECMDNLSKAWSSFTVSTAEDVGEALNTLNKRLAGER